MNKTYIPNSNWNKQWYLIDAEGKNLGRLATEIAKILRGKHNFSYTPYFDCGDNIIIINSQKINISGKKKNQKIYYRHSGRPGSLKLETFEQLQQRLPSKIIKKAVQNMLPKGPLGRKLLKKLKVYSNNLHPHTAQNPHKIHV
uniref:Large ribosomal subunit protein uL13c n=1 Tax=Lympha mucosa TaxID=2045360 RepID=A0A6B9VRM7_9FLOR|nr:ribosomal protein L13 [Lympha mucosa]